MTVQLDWPAEVVNRLTEEAHQKGLSLDVYVLESILHQNGATGAPAEEAEKRRRREQAAANIRELRKGVTLGRDLSIRDLIDEGRRF